MPRTRIILSAALVLLGSWVEAEGPVPEAPQPSKKAAAEETQQFVVKVQFYEVNLAKLRKLGLDLGVQGGSVRTVRGEDSRAIRSLVASLSKHKCASRLTDCTIVVADGQPGAFHVGGEVPVKVPQPDGSRKTEKIKIGTSVKLLAKTSEKGVVRLQVSPRIAELDNKNGVQIGKTLVPQVAVREVNFEVESESDKPIVVTGLFSDMQQGEKLLVASVQAEKLTR